MKFIPAVITVADVAAVIYIEKLLMAGKITDAGRVVPAHPKELLIFGLIFGLPALIIVLVALWRRSKGSAPQAAPRPRYTVGGPR